MARGSLFAAYSANFGAVFLDQYGVLHDGARPYPGAIEALQTLRTRKARVVILSNSGRSGDHNAQRMARLGIARSLYDHFVTSGDVARAALLREDSPLRLSSKTRCMTLASADSHALSKSLGLAATQDAAEADLLVIGGSQAGRISLDDYERLIAPAAARGVPCVCTNPDKMMLTPGGIHPGAGAIAERYERLGGRVHWIGKPYAGIYEAAALLAGSPAPHEVLCVGDSVEHDIVGAHRFGAAAALVRTGILAGLSESELAAECARHAAVPDIVLRDLAV